MSNSRIKVAFVNNWGQDPSSYLEAIKSQSPGSTCIWGSIEGVHSLQEADCIMAFDGAPNSRNPAINKKQKVILAQREPDHVYAFEDLIGADTVFPYAGSSYPPHCRWGLSYSYDELKRLEYPLDKIKSKATCVLSNKSFTDGMKKRLKFVNALCNLYPDMIDLYSSTLSEDFFGKSYKGPVPPISPTSQIKMSATNSGINSLSCQMGALYPYEKSLSLENGRLKNFMTRTTEAVLCWTLPLYWGCPNINDFFKGGYRWIDIENPDVGLSQFVEAINEPITDSVIDEIRVARNKVLDEYNVWAVTEKMVLEAIG